MNSRMPFRNEVREEVEYESVHDSGSSGAPKRGMFRDPIHAALERQKMPHKESKIENGDRDFNCNLDNQSLKHFKLVFPVYKEGSDNLEWLRDCEEYFTIYEVADRRRAAIAAMHLRGVPKSWYKSFMIGRRQVTWHQFSEAFIARFGQVETELVF